MPFIDFKEMFSKDFRDPEFAIMYLEETLNMEVPTFLLALRDVIDANCGTSKVTPETSAAYLRLYKTLSANGFPEFEALQAALASVGMRFSIVPVEAQGAGEAPISEETQATPRETAKAA